MSLGYMQIPDGRVVLFRTKDGLDFPVVYWDSLEDFIPFADATQEFVKQCHPSIPQPFRNAFEEN